MPFPPPDTPTPVVFPDGSTFQGTVFLNAVLDHPNLSIGDYTYYSDDEMPDVDLMRRRLFPYLYGDQKIEIGKFCSLAMGVSFVTDSANHRYDGISAYPFAIFDGMSPDRASMPRHSPRPMRVGNDCWIGRDAMLTPTAQLGDGVIVGAGAVVSGRVPDYAIVAGNPARVVRMRFSDDEIARLKAVSWWDWPIDAILAAEPAICGGDIDALERAAPSKV
ncbi:CatB-related O-acetyltransferase [Marivita sp. S6314]|uniref:CatB-related O-acetyltransferase n=1 Tax=Marivita sp. S6314 TaxID=2926406 RepID=UPI001FF1F6D6|nr:CatB-related O-acetyltransferase [Marivita sp. S6314]MCK0152052.1 CatB-related O-acetyltransferase [Marivita sp. S6314]